ncbi:hypothetical protein FOFC_08134 [Fusarium oxysporum]|nr:hypothetical protein FOFC_08134 [Fusarium oxysporum]
MAMGLRHNYDISFIVTKCKGLSLIYYETNYATKVEDPVWKRIVAAKELIWLLSDGKARSWGDGHAGQGGTEDLIVTGVSPTRQVLEGLALYDYISVVKLKWKGQGIASDAAATEATDYRVAATQSPTDSRNLRQVSSTTHSALCPWDMFLCEATDGPDDINKHLEKTQGVSSQIQLPRRSAEDGALDARQWGVLSGKSDPIADVTGSHSTDRNGSHNAAVYGRMASVQRPA